jgi:hypothetical protein
MPVIEMNKRLELHFRIKKRDENYREQAICLKNLKRWCR